MKTGWIMLACAALGTLTTASITLAQDTPASASSAAAPVDEKIYGCIEGFSDILPGEYYACRARYHFQRGHNAQGVEMLKDAAHWANKDAQYALGLMFYNGDMPGIPANRPLALAWLALAAERKKPDYMQTYATARQQSSPQDLRAGGLLWQTMRREYGDKVAGLRALRRFNQEVKPLEDASKFGGIAYLNGYSPFPETANKVVDDLHAIADRAFDGLQGTVTVGSLQTK
ncbi:hypothetical protein [Rhodanobacter sp. L36]|uniref:hypothetical protein n=1 Tax=Rhodanobacter sp. L36 TaxID=1747221 RepID=UPI00131CC2EE|nr:hypothetical protein [Rhodanobacter sp. L36]